MKQKLLAILLILTAIFCGCKKEKQDIDISNVSLDLKIERFDQDFWALRDDTLHLAENLEKLNEAYPFWCNDYLTQVLQLGRSYNDELVRITLPKFYADSSVMLLYTDALNAYKDIEDINTSLIYAFKRAMVIFPEAQIPIHIYMHVSGFNQSIIIGEDYMSISIDKYLGEDYPLYDYNIYDYLHHNMCRERIPADVIRVWTEAVHPFVPNEGQLLEDILYEGKLTYITSLLLPELADSTLMGYTQLQLEWCQLNEPTMWRTIIENKHLFTQESVWRSKYLHDAPFTQPFTQGSPGRAGVYIGWQIIKNYMARNPQITPLELMLNNNSRQILELSGYNPQ